MPTPFLLSSMVTRVHRYEPAALAILKAKKDGKYIILQADAEFRPPEIEYREVFGVVLSQKRNDTIFSAEHLKNLVTKAKELPADAARDLIVASIAIKYTQSNSVGYALNGQMIGIGAGQQSRVDCVKLAGRKLDTWCAPPLPLTHRERRFGSARFHRPFWPDAARPLRRTRVLTCLRHRERCMPALALPVACCAGISGAIRRFRSPRGRGWLPPRARLHSAGRYRRALACARTASQRTLLHPAALAPPRWLRPAGSAPLAPHARIAHAHARIARATRAIRCWACRSSQD
jgi:hypothetical protein